MWDQYEFTLRSLGAKHLYHLRVETRADAESPRAMAVLEGATAVFFTGGDQLRLGVRLHVLSQGDEFDLITRTPKLGDAGAIDDERRQTPGAHRLRSENCDTLSSGASPSLTRNVLAP